MWGHGLSQLPFICTSMLSSTYVAALVRAQRTDENSTWLLLMVPVTATNDGYNFKEINDSRKGAWEFPRRPSANND